MKTFDGHDDKVWGLAVNSANTIVISAAADSKIIFWEVSCLVDGTLVCNFLIL